jgi:hypothetical protein
MSSIRSQSATCGSAPALESYDTGCQTENGMDRVAEVTITLRAPACKL